MNGQATLCSRTPCPRLNKQESHCPCQREVQKIWSRVKQKKRWRLASLASRTKSSGPSCCAVTCGAGSNNSKAVSRQATINPCLRLNKNHAAPPSMKFRKSGVRWSTRQKPATMTAQTSSSASSFVSLSPTVQESGVRQHFGHPGDQRVSMGIPSFHMEGPPSGPSKPRHW